MDLVLTTVPIIACSTFMMISVWGSINAAASRATAPESYTAASTPK